MTTMNLLGQSQVSDKPVILYDLKGLSIGQLLYARERQVTVRSVFAPNSHARWQHIAEIVDTQTHELLSLETGSMVKYMPAAPRTDSRCWIKYQGREVWVVYVQRFGQLQRFQGGTFEFLDARPCSAEPEVPRGSIEVIGNYSIRLRSLLAMCNDERLLSGEEMPADFFTQLEPLASEWNEIAARSFWHYDV